MSATRDHTVDDAVTIEPGLPDDVECKESGIYSTSAVIGDDGPGSAVPSSGAGRRSAAGVPFAGRVSFRSRGVHGLAGISPLLWIRFTRGQGRRLVGGGLAGCGRPFLARGAAVDAHRHR